MPHRKTTATFICGVVGRSGDTVQLELPMPIHRVYAHEKVEEDRGKVALMRGPIVYCLEAVDHPEVDVSRLALPRDADLRAEHRSELLGGVTVLRGNALAEGQPRGRTHGRAVLRLVQPGKGPHDGVDRRGPRHGQVKEGNAIFLFPRSLQDHRGEPCRPICRRPTGSRTWWDALPGQTTPPHGDYSFIALFTAKNIS